MQQMSLGVVVNIAARLQQRAEPGQALVGPACHAAACDTAELEPLGEIELKGIGTIHAWSLVGIAEIALSVALPFVGRQSELGLLEYARQRAISGRSVLALECAGLRSLSRPSQVGLRSLGLVGWSQRLASGSGTSAPH